MLESQGLDELVNIKDEYAHGLKIDVKEGYEDINQLFYLIPNNVCAKGLPKSNTKKLNYQRYGALVWKNIKEYYDRDGDKE